MGQSIGPLSLSEIFYKFSDGIIGRNTRIKTENEICWKSFDFLQNKFAKEWKKWKDGDESDDNEANECFDDKEIESFDPSFRALIDLDKNFKNDSIIKTNVQKKKKRKKSKKRKREKVARSIFVSGLPLNITLDEISAFFGKAGVIATDIYKKGKKKIALYGDGNGLITFYQPYSVKLALDILDETQIKNGYPVHIKAAKDPKPTTQQRKKQKINPAKEAMLKKLYGVDAELNWNDDAEHNGLHWIVLQNVFSQKQANENGFIDELKREIVTECNTKIGPIDKLQIFESNPNGIIKIKFKFAAHSKLCIKTMNGRLFDGNVIKCEYWDGQTQYAMLETEKQQRMRLEKFQNDIKGKKYK